MEKPGTEQAPAHLEEATGQWWESVVKDYDLEPHHKRLLTLACEAWDRANQAREAVAEHGLTMTNRHGDVKPRPEVIIERDARIAFARLLRELNLDESEAPEARRPPRLKYAG